MRIDNHSRGPRARRAKPNPESSRAARQCRLE
jgi:hypothetical protein